MSTGGLQDDASTRAEFFAVLKSQMLPRRPDSARDDVSQPRSNLAMASSAVGTSRNTSRWRAGLATYRPVWNHRNIAPMSLTIGLILPITVETAFITPAGMLRTRISR